MLAPRPRFNLGLIHHAPGIHPRLPYLTATTGVASHLAAVARRELVTDEVQGVKVLRKDDYSMSLCHHGGKPVLKSVELTVHCHLIELDDVILQVEPFGFQSLAPPWVLVQSYETLALPVEKGSNVRLVVLVLVVLRYIPAEVTLGVNVSKALLNGSDQIP